jgi:hypothetical protein
MFGARVWLAVRIIDVCRCILRVPAMANHRVQFDKWRSEFWTPIPR